MHRAEPAVAKCYALAAGKRPGREILDVRKDPYQMRNVAKKAAYASAVKRLDGPLMAGLKASGDPCATVGGDEFDRYI